MNLAALTVRSGICNTVFNVHNMVRLYSRFSFNMAPWGGCLSYCVYRWLQLQVTSNYLGSRRMIERYKFNYLYSFLIKPFKAEGVAFYSQHNVGSKITDEKKKGPKSGTYTKITLLDTDGSVKITVLEEADKVARRRDLKLVKITDKESNTLRPVYKMMTKAQFLEEDLENRKLKKEKKITDLKAEKLLSLSDKIAPHDLQAKVKMILKWLSKRHEVRVSISESDAELSSKVCETIESTTKEHGKLVQKRSKGKETKFSILPVLKKSEEIVSDNSNDKNS